MPLFSEGPFERNLIATSGPYQVEPFSCGWQVCDSRGVVAMTGPCGSIATMDKTLAEKLAQEWNRTMAPDDNKVDAPLGVLNEALQELRKGQDENQIVYRTREAISVLIEALAESRREAARLSCYQRAVNKIDDLVEYREFTKADIHKILATLTTELQEPHQSQT